MAAVVYFVKDLMFSSKILEAAGHLGIDVQGAWDVEQVATMAHGARLVIVDLRLPDGLRALERLAADPEAAGVASVGFVEHERLDVMETARALGCGTVLAKGAFASGLPALLARAAKP